MTEAEYAKAVPDKSLRARVTALCGHRFYEWASDDIFSSIGIQWDWPQIPNVRITIELRETGCTHVKLHNIETGKIVRRVVNDTDLWAVMMCIDDALEEMENE